MNTAPPPTSDGPLLRIESLTKVYRGGKKANDAISLDLQRGEVFGLLGPNGAGKTTLVNQVIGLLRPDSGTIRLEGVDVVRHPETARRLCSYLPQSRLPIDSLPIRRAIELIGGIRGGRGAALRERTARLIDALEIGEWADKPGARTSGGVRRLVGFAMALVWPTPLVILDEPTNDVDPLRRRLLWREVRRAAAEGSGVLLVTHNVLEAERAVDRLAVVDAGKTLAQGTPATLTGGDGRRLRLELTLEPGAEAPALPASIELHARVGRRLLTHIAEAEASRALDWVGELKTAGVVEAFEVGPTTLEDAYLRLIGRADVIEPQPSLRAEGA